MDKMINKINSIKTNYHRGCFGVGEAVNTITSELLKRHPKQSFSTLMRAAQLILDDTSGMEIDQVVDAIEIVL